MFQGKLLGIFAGPTKAANLQSVEQIEAETGRGLVGDRYFLEKGTFTKPGSADREVTLIEMEAIEALEHENQITLQPAQSRRNLVTRGVPLNHLVGQEFMVGEVRLRGIRLCEPCDHLESLTIKGVLKGLLHRGGLRAQILQGGILHTGDPITPCSAES